MTRDEENRALAEWAGYRMVVDSFGNDPFEFWHHPSCECKSDTPKGTCTCHDACDPEPPNFRTNAEAAFALIEKLFALGFILEVYPQSDGPIIVIFRCGREEYGRGSMVSSFLDGIAGSALALIEKEKQNAERRCLP